MKHIWIGNNRYLVTDNFDEGAGSEDMAALGALNDAIAARAADPAFQAELDRKHVESHARRCCREHGTHTMPHRGCILR